MVLGPMSYSQDQQPPAQDAQAGAREQQPAPPPPSLGEIARQLKLKKQQKEAQLKPAKATASPDATPSPEPAKSALLVASDDAPGRASVTPVAMPSTPEATQTKAGEDDQRANAEKWKSEILKMKSAIAAFEQDIKSRSDSIHYAGANCVANCAQWNERQQQKQQEVDTMKAQLEEAQKQLQDTQEAARKQGFGSSVYDP